MNCDRCWKTNALYYEWGHRPDRHWLCPACVDEARSNGAFVWLVGEEPPEAVRKARENAQ